jgi:hypothetical protein
MKLASALVGLVALGSVAFSSAAASAMPVTRTGEVLQASSVRHVAYFCNAWGRCWYRPIHRGRYYHRYYYGGWGWHRGWGGWHHWNHW